MEAYSGFEPHVGEIRAVRTYRIGPGGWLYPLFNTTAWPDGPHAAQCMQIRLRGGVPHAAPDPDCTCGFYAYASAIAAAEQPNARHVLAVIACWGRVIAGTRGIRAEHARLEALWMSPKVPRGLVAEVVSRYPSVRTYEGLPAMFAEHPLTKLDCYEPDDPGRGVKRLGMRIIVAVALVLGILPAHWFGSNTNGRIAWGLEMVFFLAGAAVMGRRRTDPTARPRALLFVAVALWLLAPFAGPVGVVLLRLPLLQIGAILFVHRLRLTRAANRFPADIGKAAP